MFQSLENLREQNVHLLILIALFDELRCNSGGRAIAEHDFLGGRTQVFRLVDNNEALMNAIE